MKTILNMKVYKMIVALRDFLCQMERQAIFKACKTFNLPLELREEACKRADGVTTNRKYKVAYADRGLLVTIIECYKKKYEENKHYSSFQAVTRHVKNLKQMDKYLEGLKSEK